jgi:hypothetical protein
VQIEQIKAFAGDADKIEAALLARNAWPATITFQVPGGFATCEITREGDTYHWQFDRAIYEPPASGTAYECGEAIANEYWGNW